MIIFVTGTDTDVGKTLITGALARILYLNKIDVAIMKPFESGVNLNTKGEIPPNSDTDFLNRCAGGNFHDAEINMFRFSEPLSPSIAASRAGIKINFDAVARAIKKKSTRHKITLIEGAGGLLSPLVDKKSNLDLIKKLKAKVIIISRLELGTLNHTRLTWQALKKEKIRPWGVILNQTHKKLSLAAKTNAHFLSQDNICILGTMPYLANPKPENIHRHTPQSIKKNILLLCQKYET